MNNSKMNQPVRRNIKGWAIIASGDNDVEIIEHTREVDSFKQAVDIANELGPLVAQYEPLNSVYTIHVNLTRSMVGVRMSVPKGFWESEAQEKLAQSVVELASQ